MVVFVRFLHRTYSAVCPKHSTLWNEIAKCIPQVRSESYDLSLFFLTEVPLVTMCQFLMYSTMSQSFIYIHIHTYNVPFWWHSVYINCLEFFCTENVSVSLIYLIIQSFIYIRTKYSLFSSTVRCPRLILIIPYPALEGGISSRSSSFFYWRMISESTILVLDVLFSF